MSHGGRRSRGEGTREAVHSSFVDIDLLQLDFFSSVFVSTPVFSNLDFASPFQLINLLFDFCCAWCAPDSDPMFIKIKEPDYFSVFMWGKAGFSIHHTVQFFIVFYRSCFQFVVRSRMLQIFVILDGNGLQATNSWIFNCMELFPDPDPSIKT